MSLQEIWPEAERSQVLDRLREDLGKYYERQERAFQNLSDVGLAEQGFDEHKAIELTKLARTFLVSDGEIDKMTRFREVFEDDRLYNRVFDRARLKADSRKIVLCYKVQFRLGRLAKDIAGRGAQKYAYVLRTRDLLWALLCQAILNDPNIEEQADNFGHRLSLEPQYTEWLSTLATTRCRYILSDLTEEKTYTHKAREGNFTFMKTSAAYQRSMEIAHKRWKWVAKRLK